MLGYSRVYHLARINFPAGMSIPISLSLTSRCAQFNGQTDNISQPTKKIGGTDQIFCQKFHKSAVLCLSSA